MKIEYFEVIKDVDGLLQKGDKFFCWDGIRMYHEKSDENSAYLEKRIVAQHGFDTYFKTCAAFPTPLLVSLREKLWAKTLDYAVKIVALQNQLKERKKEIKILDKLLK